MHGIAMFIVKIAYNPANLKKMCVGGAKLKVGSLLR